MKKPNIRFKSVLSRIKDIQKRNEYFDELGDQGKRLEIAWDALNLVSSGVIRASWGEYWSSALRESSSACSDSKDMQLLLNSDSAIVNCSVCARGSIMLSLIRLGNKVSPADYDKIKGHKRNLRGFSYDSMIRVESEYENERYNHPYRSNTEEKLMNILCNVLVNGDFNPEDKTDYLI